jgi:hypothetical protein
MYICWHTMYIEYALKEADVDWGNSMSTLYTYLKWIKLLCTIIYNIAIIYNITGITSC